jgi:hypothetical protein
MEKILIKIIRLYQRFISPFLPLSCRFYPTCSDYACQALSRYGICKGLGFTIWRLLRCHPYCRGGYDPVR